MRFAFPITKTTKMEDGRLLIEGTATSEAMDSQGDIMDYDGSKAAFAKWRGNLREAHDPKKPVGKALEILPDDKAKAIDVRAFVSSGAQDTQAKVLDGTLSMFSVGGGTPKKTQMEKVGGKTARRVLEWDMVELSLVDVGANPYAAFTLAKGDVAMDAISEPVEACTKADVPADCKIPGHAEMSPEEHAKAHEGEEKAAVPEEKPDGKPEEKSATPEVKKTDGMAAYDVQSALDCLTHMEGVRANEKYEVMAGEPEPPEQLKDLDTAISAWKRFIASEAQELLETVPQEKGRRVYIVKFGGVSLFDETMVELVKASRAKLDEIEKKLDAPVQKSATAPEPDARIDSLQKTVDEIKAGNGDLKVIREGVEKILAQPVPGRAPVRMAPTMEKAAGGAAASLVASEMAWRSADDPGKKADLLRDHNFARLACGLPPL